MKGTPTVLLRDLAGHKTLAMVNHYTQVATGYLDKVVQAVEIRGLEYAGDELVTRGGGGNALVDITQPVEIMRGQSALVPNTNLIDEHKSLKPWKVLQNFERIQQYKYQIMCKANRNAECNHGERSARHLVRRVSRCPCFLK